MQSNTFFWLIAIFLLSQSRELISVRLFSHGKYAIRFTLHMKQFSKQAELPVGYEGSNSLPGLSVFRNSIPSDVASIDFYTCHPATQTVIQSQIVNWTTAEFELLKVKSNYFTVLSSLDRTRIIHIVGYNTGGNLLENVDIRFDQFRNRASGPNALPVALLENSHLYEVAFALPINERLSVLQSNPDAYVSIDLFNCRAKENHRTVVYKFIDALKYLNEDPDGSQLPPDLLSIQVLSSIDTSNCILLGVWNSGNMTLSHGYRDLWSNNVFLDYYNEISNLVAVGIYSDIIERVKPFRLSSHITVKSPYTESTSSASDSRETSSIVKRQ